MASLLRCVLLLHLIFLRADGYGYAVSGPPYCANDRGHLRRHQVSHLELFAFQPEFSFCQRVCLFLKEYGIGWKWVTLTVDMGLFPIAWYVDLITAAPLSVLEALLGKLCSHLDYGCSVLEKLPFLKAEAIAAYIVDLVRLCGCTG
ncbi:hypothetical protein C7M84_011760 [Penaeus vannamei]|uniref:Uncharacterized protein n=1 Tax=Penaeus vannamei TaxID=6689 RepID=A0A3R7Q6R9_PENVA|nr:hypothetical protein C7M84_011760 [Penaeus vannamei]